MRVFVCGLVTALALGGCQSTRPASDAAASQAPFDPAAAAYIKKKGSATISGHAFWRDEKGGTINAAGEIIRLVPATDYARARFAVLYRGQRSIPAQQIVATTPDPAYADYTRTTRAEANGRFEFDHVAPGLYFVTAQVRYRDKDEYVKFSAGGYTSIQRVGQDGGAMFETVTVTGREDKALKLVLTNDR